MNLFDRLRDRDGDDGRHTLVWIAAFAIVVLALAVMGPRLISQVRGDDSEAGGASEQPGVTVVAETIGPTTSTTVAPATSTTVLEASSPPLDPSTASMPAALTAQALPLTIQIVPPVRDVVVNVGDTTFISDPHGRIVVPAAARTGSVEFIGPKASPPLQEVELLWWSDGPRTTVRPADSIESTLVVIGVEVRSRVIVSADAPIPPAALIRFSSEQGSIDLRQDTAEWVPTVRVVGTTDGITSERLTYAVEAVSLDGTLTFLPYQEFTADPEAVWKVLAS